MDSVQVPANNRHPAPSWHPAKNAAARSTEQLQARLALLDAVLGSDWPGEVLLYVVAFLDGLDADQP